MTDFGVPRRDDAQHGEHVEQDRPLLEDPPDDSAPPDDPAGELDPGNAPAHPIKPN